VVVALMLVGWTWEALKEGFVRHDTHDLTFFGLMLLALCLARLPRPLVPVQACAVVIAAVLACVANGHPPPSLHSPAEDAAALGKEVRDLVVPRQWAGVEAYARTEVLASGDRLPPALVSAIEGHTLAVETLEDAATFAYPQLRWDPEPVLQSYSAYTSELDHLDANFLASSAAPERILYKPVTINDRDPWWEPPATLEAMYCHYVPLGTSDHWLLLARVADRCGSPTVIGAASARFGQPIKVPADPGKMVLATFSLATPLVDRAEAVALKGPEIDVTAWYGTSARETYRFIPGTAADDHVVRVPGALGYPPAFAPPAVRELEFAGDGWSSGQGSVHVTFYSVSVRRR